MDLDALSWDALCDQKEDLQKRLARFQQAFDLKHGRNPAGEELTPAKPAIKRYRAVCKEISLREQEAAELYAAQQDAAGVPPYLRAGGAAQVAELAVHGAQSAAMTSNIAVSGGAVERAMTRRTGGGAAAPHGNAVANAGGGAMQTGVDGMQTGGVSAASGGAGMGCMDLLPSTATVELVANGLQYMQLSYALLAQVSPTPTNRPAHPPASVTSVAYVRTYLLPNLPTHPPTHPHSTYVRADVRSYPPTHPPAHRLQGVVKMVEGIPDFDINLRPSMLSLSMLHAPCWHQYVLQLAARALLWRLVAPRTRGAQCSHSGPKWQAAVRP